VAAAALGAGLDAAALGAALGAVPAATAQLQEQAGRHVAMFGALALSLLCEL